MINITSIKKLKNDKYIIETEENNKKNIHILSENTIIRYNLLSKKPLSKDEYKRIIKDSEYDLLYLKAIHYISYQMRTISEVKKHLSKDTQNEKLINRIILELKNNKYVNDSTYVKEYVRDKIEYDLVGPKYIREKLITKGIHYDLITNELLQFDEEKQYEKVSMIIDKETRYKLKKPYQKVYVQLKQKCLTKGFKSSVVESCIQNRKDDIIAMIDEEDLLGKELSKLIKNYDIKDYKQKDKLIKKLISKGYNYNVIKQHLK